MSRQEPKHPAKWPWSVPLAVADVPETGRHLELAADDQVRAAIAKLAELRSLPHLEATFDVALRGRDGLHVSGQVAATVGQVCVVTLDPIDNEIEEDIDLEFVPGAASLSDDRDAEDAPEALVEGTVDLGAIATEFLLLAIDPHPRKSGATFESLPKEDEGAHPFAALAALKKRQSEPRN